MLIQAESITIVNVSVNDFILLELNFIQTESLQQLAFRPSGVRRDSDAMGKYRRRALWAFLLCHSVTPVTGTPWLNFAEFYIIGRL